MLQILSNIDVVAERFARAAEFAAVAKGAQLAQLGLDGRETVETIIKRNTPVGPGYDETPHLLDSTTSDDLAFTDDSVTSVTRQTKTINIQDDQVPLWQVLTTGHKAPPNGIRPIDPENGPKALFWPGLAHPVMFSRGGAAAPDPYIEDSIAEARPIIAESVAFSGETFAGRILQVLH